MSFNFRNNEMLRAHEVITAVRNVCYLTLTRIKV